MSKLKAIKPEEAEARKPKIVIFGKAGVGKTWASIDFPLVYYVDAEGGATRDEYKNKLREAKAGYYGVEQGAGDFDDVLEEVKALATEEHPYKTLVIDSFTKIFLNEVAKEHERLNAEKLKDEYGASKKPAVRKSRQLVNWLGKLDMNVILVCHEKQLYEGGEAVGFTFDGYEKLDYELDLVMRIVKTGATRKAFIVKSRLKNFPEGNAFEWSYNKFSEMYGRDVIERESTQITLITPDQKARLEELLDIVKIEPDWLDKALARARVSDFSELSTEQAQKLIDFLEKKRTA